jgi:hypothetical protein
LRGIRSDPNEVLLLTSEGTEVEQELIECGAGIECAAARDGVRRRRACLSDFLLRGVQYVALDMSSPVCGEESGWSALECSLGVRSDLAISSGG